MIRALVLGLALLVPWPVALAQEAPKGAQGEFQTLQRELQTEQQKVLRQYSQAKSEKEKEELVDQYYGTFADHLVKLCKFAKDHEGDPAAKSARNAMNVVLTQLSRSGSAGALKHLRAAQKIAPKDVQGRIALAIGQSLRTQYEKAYQEKSKTADKLLQEAEATAKQTALDYPELARQTKDFLFELQHLTVGRPAMDIAAEDLDGTPFKLSDYRGKVVVLDFWGNW
jgi:hypothetical protein